MTIFNQMQHRNIVQLFDSFETQNHMCFIMELCGGGDLLSYVQRRKSLSEPVSAFLFKQICEAVAYCHNKQIVHRDLKPENLLLCADGVIKLCDFGLSSKVSSVKFSDVVGTP
jgi:serine/threonine protein kinase